MNVNRVRQLFMTTGCSALALGLATMAFAPSASAAAAAAAASGKDSNSMLSEVVVTATRRAESTIKVPQSIIAYDQRSLDVQSVRSLDDLTSLTPGLDLTRNAEGKRHPGQHLDPRHRRQRPVADDGRLHRRHPGAGTR